MGVGFGSRVWESGFGVGFGSSVCKLGLEVVFGSRVWKSSLESWVRKLGLEVVFLKLVFESWVLEFVFGILFCMFDLEFSVVGGSILNLSWVWKLGLEFGFGSSVWKLGF